MPPTELPLKAIHLPELIAAWPFAIGWWITLLVIPSVLWIMLWIYRRFMRNTPIKSARKLLSQLKQDKTLNDAQKLAQISILIRRVAISIAPRSDCAGLTGQAWLEYLDKSLKNKEFSQGVGRVLEMNYQPALAKNINIDELINLTERWLKAQKKF
jgi:hypothetical protein